MGNLARGGRRWRGRDKLEYRREGWTSCAFPKKRWASLKNPNVIVQRQDAIAGNAIRCNIDNSGVNVYCYMTKVHRQKWLGHNLSLSSLRLPVRDAPTNKSWPFHPFHCILR